MRDIRIAAAQFKHRDGDKAHDLEWIRHPTRKAVDDGAEIVCFHKLCVRACTRIQAMNPGKLAGVAEPAPNGPGIRKVTRIAKDHSTIATAGLLEIDSERFYNCHVTVGLEGYVEGGGEGTVHVVSVAGSKMNWPVVGKGAPMGFAKREAQDRQFLQIVSIDGDRLRREAWTATGVSCDVFTLVRQGRERKGLIQQIPDAPARRRDQLSLALGPDRGAVPLTPDEVGWSMPGQRDTADTRIEGTRWRECARHIDNQAGTSEAHDEDTNDTCRKPSLVVDRTGSG